MGRHRWSLIVSTAAVALGLLLAAPAAEAVHVCDLLQPVQGPSFTSKYGSHQSRHGARQSRFRISGVSTRRAGRRRSQFATLSSIGGTKARTSSPFRSSKIRRSAYGRETSAHRCR